MCINNWIFFKCVTSNEELTVKKKHKKTKFVIYYNVFKKHS